MRGTVLLVDDTPDIAALLCGVLAEAGYRVLVAPTVTVGLQILAALQVGLVLTDASPHGAAPSDDNWADLDRLARAAGTAPLILCSERNPAQYGEYAAHGFAAHLVKPFDLDALLALVGALLPAGGQHPPGADRPATTGER